MEDNAPVNVDAILQSILGRGGERFCIAALVLRGERIIALGAAGVRNRATTERITLNDRFHLGSCTKAMTATLVAMLVEEGRLNWTTTFGELLGDTVKPMHPAWKKATLRQLLAHRASLPFEPESLAQVFKELVGQPARARADHGEPWPTDRVTVGGLSCLSSAKEINMPELTRLKNRVPNAAPNPSCSCFGLTL